MFSYTVEEFENAYEKTGFKPLWRLDVKQIGEDTWACPIYALYLYKTDQWKTCNHEEEAYYDIRKKLDLTELQICGFTEGFDNIVYVWHKVFDRTSDEYKESFEAGVQVYNHFKERFKERLCEFS